MKENISQITEVYSNQKLNKNNKYVKGQLMVNGLNNYGTRLGPNNKSQIALPDLSIGNAYGNSRSNSNLKSLKQQKAIYTNPSQPQLRQRGSRNTGLSQNNTGTGEKMESS